MMIGLLWIIGSYAASILLVHWCCRRVRHEGRKAVRVWLITNNNQLQMEWFIRYLHFSSWLKGKDIQMTIADQGSTDDTLAIVERLRFEYWIEVRHVQDQETLEDWIVGDHNYDQALVVRLGNQDVLDNAYKML
ncbi:hypothetical protein [Paenibacillus agricola]|uniref:Glycosyl transferase family 2 n=1 Tax=Paenibacillus agricola TaxID=2716264 RepID=A0ABX0JF28_9BACL|nr:hypothetical protein [Paenibacillus agricola]NHN33859.1 hypothetical protein [Paenibacillus agricola]